MEDRLRDNPSLKARLYQETIPESMFSESMRKVLREYSGIPDDQVEEHIYKIREEAWNVFPFACTGRFSFLQLSIGDAPEYNEVLTRAKAGERVLDFGCCFGQDIRKLVYDGVPSDNLFGSDLNEEFFSLGYDLFNDRDKLKATFIGADALAESSALDGLEGTVDIIHASSLFHLFEREKQVQLGIRCVRLLRHKPGSLIFGRQAGNVDAGMSESRPREFQELAILPFRHNEESWRELWKEISEKTGTKWDVRVWLYENDMPGMGSDTDGRKRMRFAMRME